MSRRVSDACLVGLSALMTSFTFKMRGWTGISRSVEWPIGAAVLLMIVWLIVQRKEGLRISLLLASSIGIGLGLAVATVAHRIEMGRPPGPSVIIVLATTICAWMYFRIEKRERDAADEMVQFERELEAIKTLPPDQVVEAFRAHLSQIQQQLGDAEQSSKRFFRLASILIALAMLAIIASFPASIRPEPKPLMIVTDATILVLGLAWFVKLALMKRAERNSPAPPPEVTD